MKVEPPVVDTRAGFHAAIAWGFEQAIAQDARRILCCDQDFALWPWDHAPTLALLGNWLRKPQRSLVLLARSYDSLPRCHPRFNRWRVDYAHAIAAWRLADDVPAEPPCVLVADRPVSVQLIDPVHSRGRASDDERVAQRWREVCDVVLQRCEPALAVRMLGL